MSQIEITPALLAELREKAEKADELLEGKWCVEGPKSEVADHIAAANPAVVLALVAEIERLRASDVDLIRTELQFEAGGRSC